MVSTLLLVGVDVLKEKLFGADGLPPVGSVGRAFSLPWRKSVVLAEVTTRRKDVRQRRTSFTGADGAEVDQIDSPKSWFILAILAAALSYAD